MQAAAGYGAAREVPKPICAPVSGPLTWFPEHLSRAPPYSRCRRRSVSGAHHDSPFHGTGITFHPHVCPLVPLSDHREPPSHVQNSL